MNNPAAKSDEISIRRAIFADSEDVFRWRNSPAVREASFDQKEIPRGEHEEWFRRTIESTEKELLIAHDDAAIGVLRFDINGTQATISVYLVPDRIGTGLGSATITAGVHWLKRARPEVQTVLAQIRATNHRSQSAFLRAGFSRSGEDYFLHLASS